VPVSISLGHRTVQITALRDSGNTLRDPVSGVPVIVAERSSVGLLFDADILGALRRCGENTVSFMTEIENAEQRKRFRVVPCVTVSGRNMLPAFKADAVSVGGHRADVLIAVTNSNIAEGGRFAALVGSLV